ncbi:MAG TPA: hypothetical protein DEA40_08460, partial [Parvularcula sp.]|nr:hypothetical protein [Parvularcula sp.]
MRKILKLAGAAAALSGAAFAQNNALPSKAGLLETVSATEVSSMLGEFGFTSELRKANGAASPSLVATT